MFMTECIHTKRMNVDMDPFIMVKNGVIRRKTHFWEVGIIVKKHVSILHIHVYPFEKVWYKFRHICYVIFSYLFTDYDRYWNSFMPGSDCKPEYDPAYDYGVNGDRCFHRCGEKGLFYGANWCWTE